MNEVVLEIARKYPQLLVLLVNNRLFASTISIDLADDPCVQRWTQSNKRISLSHSMSSLCRPSSFFRCAQGIPIVATHHSRLGVLQGHTLLGRIAGADAAALTDAIAKHTRAPSSISPQSHTEKPPAAPIDTSAEKAESEAQLDDRCRNIMAQSRVVLFMKGEPDAPRCGFSRKIVALLRDQGVEFTHFDILKDESVRARLKTLNDWPTFPQLIVEKEFVGGLDIVQEMVENGEFDEVVKLKV